MYDQIKTGIRIRALRIKNHYTQAEMAEILNVSIQHFRGIEAGQRGCSVDILLEIAIIFNVSLDYLVLGQTMQMDSVFVKKELQKVIENLQELQNSICQAPNKSSLYSQ